jgi:hypothetical protein
VTAAAAPVLLVLAVLAKLDRRAGARHATSG